MYCKECGKDLKSTDIFCIICGTPTGIKQGSSGNHDRLDVNSISPNDNLYCPNGTSMNQRQQEINYNLNDNLQSNGVKNNSNKKFLIIGIVALVVIGIAVTLILMNKLSPQRKLIDEYFEAINDKDASKIYDLSYTDQLKEGLPTYDEDESKVFFFTNVRLMGFSRGLYEFDAFRMVPCIEEAYGPKTDNLNLGNSKDRVLDGLEVSYDIVDIKPLEDFELYSDLLGHEEVVDMDEFESIVSRYNLETGEQIKVDIEDAYVAQVKISWEYDGNLYGMMKSWWKDDEFKEFVSKSSFEQYDTYDKAIKSMETINTMDKVYLLLLYKCDGEWYIYNGDKLASLATQYEKGKATLFLY